MALSDVLLLYTDDGSIVQLGSEAFVVVLDDTGHEDFADAHYPVYGLGGCAFRVQDYVRLVEAPWMYMCSEYLPDFDRPLHIADIRHHLTSEQIGALTHFFTRFEFFRVAVTIGQTVENEADTEVVDLVGGAMLQRIADVAQHAEFDRLAVIVEDSQRAGVRCIRSLAGRHFVRGRRTITPELFLVPKGSGLAALEVADLVVHAAGAQTRAYVQGRRDVRRDFEAIFQTVDSYLSSYLMIQRAEIADT